MKIILDTKDIEHILEAHVRWKFGQDMELVSIDTYTYAPNAPTATFTTKQKEECNTSPQ